MKIYRIDPNDNSIYASHQFVSDKRIKRMLGSDTFEFLNTAYRYIGGFHSFDDEYDFIDNSFLWYITYDGELNDMKDFDVNKVYTVSVFKQKYGLKLVGAGNNRYYHIEDEEQRKTKKLQASDALKQQLKWALNHGWIEASGALEALIRNNFSSKYIIEPELLQAAGVFKDMEIANDNLHYTRKLSNGMEVYKMAFGKIKLPEGNRYST